MKKTIEPIELKSLLKHDRNIVVIDVRRRADYESDTRMIPAAVWRDPEQREVWADELPRDQDVVIYCVRGGSVSKSVSDYLRDKGVSVRYLEGGIRAWMEDEGDSTE